jgi:hypothetical protein
VIDPAAPPAVVSPNAAALRAQLNVRDDASHWRSLMVLVGSMIIYGAFSGTSFKLDGALVLIGVLMFHELGHALGMKLFGYRDVRIFFIPMFGAATRGVAQGTSAAKRGIVLLLGPMPGLLAALVLTVMLRPVKGSLEWSVITTLAGLNALNLLPVEPFDGGRLVNLVISARYRVLDVASLVLGAVAMGLLAFAGGGVMLGVAAFLMLLSVPNRWKAFQAGRDFAARFPTLPERIEDASDEVLEALHQGVQPLVPALKQPEAQAKATANWARQLYERAQTRDPDLVTSIALVLAHGSGFVTAVATFIALAILHR